MSCIAWNCRGLGNARAVRHLKAYLAKKVPKLVFLSETKLFASEGEELRRMLRFDNCFIVECERHQNTSGNRKGGLMALWNQDVTVQVNISSQHIIDLSITEHVMGVQWRFTGFYGHPVTHQRWTTFQMLNDIHQTTSGAWLVMGDFNEILSQEETTSSTRRPSAQMTLFQETLDTCGLFDMGFKGYAFTWASKWGKFRLNRGVANASWLGLYPNAQLTNDFIGSGDHRPICLELDQYKDGKRGKRQFKYELYWRKDPSTKEVVQAVWNLNKERGAVNCIRRLVGKGVSCGRELSKWDREKYGDIPTRVNTARKEIERLYLLPHSLEREKEMEDKEGQFRSLLELEECWWKQRSRINWLKDGDCNTSFFHNWANARRRVNSIQFLEAEDGRRVDRLREMFRLAENYFTGLFTTSNPENCERVVDCIKGRLVDRDREGMIKPISEEEILNAMRAMHPSKAPGPDGFSVGFYLDHWLTIKEDIMEVCHAFFSLNEGENLDYFGLLNETVITLVPKVNNAKRMKDFRPIALCNVLYKVITKVLANRMQHCLDYLISESQSAFVPGRLITDNALICHECLEVMRRRRQSRKEEMALKLDMSKAYDRVEWEFLFRVMERMNFHPKWINWIRVCLTTVRYRVKFNGSISRAFTGTRGIRQGDPISPYLFLLCSEGLSGLLEEAAHMKLIRGVKICPSAPLISHLFFADDAMLFCRARVGDIDTIMRCLAEYSSASGQMVNIEKTALFFSSNTSENRKQQIRNRLGCEGKEIENYLGFPAWVDRHKIMAFKHLKEKVCKRLSSLNGRLLSSGGKEVLIKAILQAIPTYTMSLFLIPTTLCNELTSMFARFWWGESGDKRRMSWCSWKKLCLPKEEGGMGFEDLHSFNVAMLAKQLWRIEQKPQSLIGRMLKVKYFPNNDLWHCEVKTNASDVWRSLMYARDTIREGCKWRVNNGWRARLCDDNWCGEAMQAAGPLLPGVNLSSRVCEFVEWETLQWDLTKVEQRVGSRGVGMVAKQPLLRYDGEDIIYWGGASTGIYSVQSGYEFIFNKLMKDEVVAWKQRNRPLRKSLSVVWKLLLPPKLRIHAWRLCMGFLATGEALNRREILVDNTCQFCKVATETMWHILFECSNTRIKEQLASSLPALNWSGIGSFTNLFSLPSRQLDMETKALIVAASWRTWYLRNLVIFEQKVVQFDHVLLWSSNYLHEWSQSHSRSLHGDDGLVSRWRPPPQGYFKVNCDAGSLTGSGRMYSGAVIRDSEGRFYGAKTWQFQGEGDALFMEAQALLHTIRWCLAHNLYHVVFETDSLHLFRLLTDNGMVFTSLSNLIEEIRGLTTGITTYSFSHVLRSGNCVAHTLGRYGFDHQLGEQEWWGSPPAFIYHELCNDFDLHE